MKTAVEWLWRWMNDNQEATIEEGNKAFEQAKEMEKEQIRNAYNDGYFAAYKYKDWEQYYNQTYNQNK
jgi:Leu/Phe-tRNA-protein transferase